MFDPRSPPNVPFLPSNVRFFWVILDPPSPPKIGHHLCTFPKVKMGLRLFKGVRLFQTSMMFVWQPLLPEDWVITTWQLPDNCLATAWQLPNNFLTTAWQLPDNCMTTAWQLRDNCLTTAWKLPDNCLTTAGQLPDNFWKLLTATNFSGISYWTILFETIAKLAYMFVVTNTLSAFAFSVSAAFNSIFDWIFLWNYLTLLTQIVST